MRKKFSRKLLKRAVIVAAVSVSSALVLKLVVWDSPNDRWLVQDLYYRPPLNAKLTLAPPISDISTEVQSTATEIDDASRLNRTQVAAVFQPTSIAEIQAIIKIAKQHRQKVSISGARHSMGGQIVYPNSLHLDMSRFDQVQYNADKTITVQSGATWKQVQLELGKHGRAVRVMQDSNIFTIGGSLGVNAHGKDPRFGSLIESVNYFKLINAKGEEITCSRTENSELFRAVIGGMGIFGVVTEVNLKTTENVTYAYTVIHKSQPEMIPFMELQIQRPSLEMIEAQMSVDQSNYLNEAQIYYFDRTQNDQKVADDVSGENSIWLRKLVYRTSRQSEWGKQLRWFMQKQIGPSLDPPEISRNSGMAAPFRTLELDDSKTTDILQEYFIPINKIDEFWSIYKTLLLKHQMQLINVTVRKVKPDREALVSYATQEMYAFVSYYKISKSEAGNHQMSQFTQDVMNTLNNMNAKFYLAYKGHYTRAQIYQMYPSLTDLVKLKYKYDPQEVFFNKWYFEFR